MTEWQQRRVLHTIATCKRVHEQEHNLKMLLFEIKIMLHNASAMYRLVSLTALLCGDSINKAWTKYIIILKC